MLCQMLLLTWLGSLPLASQPAAAEPAAEPAAAAAEPATAEPATALDDSIGTLVFSNMPSSGVIEKLADLSGKMVLRSQSVPEVRLSFDSKEPISRSEAIRAIESLLFMNGVAVVPMGDNFIKILGAANLQGQAPTLLDLDQLENSLESEQNFARIFELEFITSSEALMLAGQFITPTGKLHELPKLNALYINDSLSALKRIHTVLQKIDTPLDFKQSVTFVSLQHVAANNLLKRLNGVKDGPLKSEIGNSTMFEADERSNQIIIFTHPQNMPFIDQLIAKLDVDVAPKTRSHLFSIDHAVADEVATLIQSIIKDQQDRTDDNSAHVANAPSADATVSTGPPTAPITLPVAVAAPQPNGTGDTSENADRFSEYATVVSDKRSNAIIAYGTPFDLGQIEYLVDQIDVPLPLVQIDVVITEVTLTNDQTRGIDSFGVSLNPDGLLDTTGDYDFNIGTTSGSRLGQPLSVAGSLQGFSLNLIFDTAKRDSNVRVLQAPSITVSHNAEGEIKIGERRPIITSSTSDISNSNNVRSQVSYEQVGINLKVTPLIGKNGAIQLKISQEISSVIDTVEIDGNDQPVIGNRLASSEVSVNDNETVILGGLQEESESKTKSRIAFFGRIPLLGKLLEGNSNEDTRREIIIFIKPHILKSKEMGQGSMKATLDNSPQSEKLRRYFETRTFQFPEPSTDTTQ
ncbi:MAG: general secretion pathway protein D [Lentimonas sp.]|jgi:general secretion pathway protein D